MSSESSLWWQGLGRQCGNCLIVEVTPVMAEGWLRERNKKNRPLNIPRVGRLKKAIESNGFVLNGETIVFSKSGMLLDGQHRLQAIVESAVAVECYVIFDVADDAFATIDTGAGRSASDTLHAAGIENSGVLGPALGYLYLWRKNGTIDLGGQQAHVSNADRLQTYYENPGIANSVPFGKSIKGLMSAAVATFVHFVLYETHPEEATEFFSKLETGAELREGDPIHTLRERLLRANRPGPAAKRKAASLSRVEVVAFAFKAWNYKRKFCDTTLLRWVPKKESFPKPI